VAVIGMAAAPLAPLACSAKARVDLGPKRVPLTESGADAPLPGQGEGGDDGEASAQAVTGDDDDDAADASEPSDGFEAATGSPEAESSESSDGSSSRSFLSDSGCVVTVASPPLLPALHVTIGSDIQWDSNPPSSGSHYPIWAAFQTYDAPVPRGYYVHDLEHGAIVFVYNCGDGGCPDVVAAFHRASDSLPDDPLCTAAGEGVRVRTVITPDPLLDVTVAAAAWGWTYKAECIDLPSLEAFASAHYAQGPEMFCTNGTTQF
jgi:hypothetical protein